MSERARHFLELHRPGTPLLLPNPWDAGIAKLLASVGFQALATTSSGHAGTLGRRDGSVTRDEVLAHAAAIASATELPLSADLEAGFADDPVGVAETVRLATATGIAGFSIEDATGREGDPIFPIEAAAERVAAAAEARDGLVLTGRAENYLHGRRDLADTVARLQAYQAAGADVLYAPGLSDLGEIEQLVAAVDRPVNVVLRPGGPTVRELAAVGVARISVGGAFHLVSLAAVEEAAREFLEDGTAGFWERAGGAAKIRAAF